MWVWAPAAGHAATVTYTWGDVAQQSLRFDAEPGERNALRVSAVAPPVEWAARKVRLSDSGAPVMTSSPGCVSEDVHTVVCDVALPLTATLGDGDDTFASTVGRPATVDGGPGNDVLTGDPAPLTAEQVRLHGEGAGGSEYSLFSGGPGDDVLIGGADFDKLWGGLGNDRLTGHGGFDVLCGGDRDGASGCSALSGSGDDILDGGRYRDYIVGGDGRDWLIGGAGADGLVAGPGDDLIDATGDAASDPNETFFEQVFAGAGNDRILSRDGQPDDLYCEGGLDSFDRDPFDKVDLGCTAPGGDSPALTGASVRAPSSVRLLPGRRMLTVSVRCPALMPSGCSGTVTVRGAGRRLARGRYKPIAAANKRTVRLRIGPSTRRVLARRTPKRVSVQITNTRAPAGSSPHVQRTARLR